MTATALPQWLIAGGQISGALAAFLIAVGVIMKSPFGKVLGWLSRQLFERPVTRVAGRIVAAAVAPQFAELRVENTMQHQHNAERLTDTENRLSEKIDEAFATHNANHAPARKTSH